MQWDNNAKLLLYVQPLQNAFGGNCKLQGVFSGQLQTGENKATCTNQLIIRNMSNSHQFGAN